MSSKASCVKRQRANVNGGCHCRGNTSTLQQGCRHPNQATCQVRKQLNAAHKPAVCTSYSRRHGPANSPCQSLQHVAPALMHTLLSSRRWAPCT